MTMKKRFKIALIVFGAIIFVWVGYAGAVKYKDWRWRQGVEKEAAKFENTLKEREKLIAADTYGGKTPQETLQMFIAAAEAGDYELASKYFVVEKQMKWKENLSTVENVEFLIKDLDKINERLIQNADFSEKDNDFVVLDPILVKFIKYPSNVWKIDEI